MQGPVLDTGSQDKAWDRFKVASYSQPAVSVRPVKLRRGRKFGRGRGRVKRGEDTEDVEDLGDDDDEEEGRVIEERSAVYPQQQAGSAYQRLGPYSFHSSYYGSQDKTPPPPQPVCEVIWLQTKQMC